MGLSCDWIDDIVPGMVCWEDPHTIAALATKRARKCASCGAKIQPGQPCHEWRRYKVPEYDIEIAIWGEDGDLGPPRASHYHCVDCGLIASFLLDHNYVFPPTDDIRELAKDHAREAGTGRGGCI